MEVGGEEDGASVQQKAGCGGGGAGCEFSPDAGPGPGRSAKAEGLFWPTNFVLDRFSSRIKPCPLRAGLVEKKKILSLTFKGFEEP